MAAMTQFRETLAMMLTTTMKAQGPVAAIEVCSASAPQLAAQAGQAGLVIGRATNRPRNQANAATGWRVDALAAFAASPRPARFERVLDDGRLAIALPLEIQAPCLTCHGTAIQPEVASTLAARYPADKATGYALGELRGVLWAEVE